MVLIRLKIKLICGNDKTIIIDDQKKLADLRETLTVVTSVPIANQRLIFRGKVLNEENLKIKDYGLEDEMAIHLVEKAPPVNNSTGYREPPSREEDPPIGLDQENGFQHQQVVAQFIHGQIPFERTVLFREPSQILNIVNSVMEQLRDQYHMETEQTLHMNRPQENDFSINVTLRGLRQRIINSPARERFDTLQIELRKLAWLVAIIQSQFLDNIDAVFAFLATPASVPGNWPNQEHSYQVVARLLHAMDAFDVFDEQHLVNYIVARRDDELLSVIEELNRTLPDDAAHIQQVSQTIAMRHCTSQNLSTYLMLLSTVDAKINEHLMSRFHRILALRHNLQPTSFPARILNLYSGAVARVNHFRAHIYHTISDLVVHVDQNDHNRLYPQYIGFYRHEEPPQAQISLLFFDPTNLMNAGQQPPSTAQSQSGPATHFERQDSQTQTNAPPRGSFGSLFAGIMGAFAQQFAGNTNREQSQRGGVLHNQNRNPTNPPSNWRQSTSRTASPNVPTPLLIQPPHPTPTHTSPPQPTASPQPFHRRQRNEPPRNVHQPRPPRLRVPVSTENQPIWGRLSPTTANAMFIGPNPPTHFPMFTMDQFLPCPSRRYRVFEIDSRHADFWNDPQTIAYGIQPPSNSIAALQREENLQNQGPPSLPAEANIGIGHPENAPSLNRGSAHAQSNSNADPTVIRAQANDRGNGVFTEIGQFAQFVRQTMESIARCMAQYDSRILPQPSIAPRGFTADTRVASYIPLVSMPPVPFPHPGMPANFFGTPGSPHETVIGISFEQSQQLSENNEDRARNN